MGSRSDIIARIPLPAIDKVIFFQRDELTTDLICCNVVTNGVVHSFHEEMKDWATVIHHLERLPGFLTDWYQRVTVEAFAPNRIVAYER